MHVRSSSYVVEHYGQNCLPTIQDLRWRRLVVNPVYIQLVMQREPTTIMRTNMRKLLANEGKDNRKTCFSHYYLPYH